jgi:type VI secretion system protein ImpK
MHESVSPLACFSAFYAEVAMMKQAAAERRLGALLSAPGDSGVPAGAELAGRINARLAGFLDRQRTQLRVRASSAELDAYDMTRRAMAALADEVFAIELDWSGRQAWLDNLLELTLFHTRHAGSRFFDDADALIGADRRHGPWQEVAAVWLLALQLGFKGRLRGAEAETALQQYRQALYRLARTGAERSPRAFPQAYAHCLVLQADRRLAPLDAWRKAGLRALGLALLASALYWLACSALFLDTARSLQAP